MPELIEPVEVINKRLSTIFGNSWDSRPIYRIVFSNDEYERRYGTWEDYGPHDIFLRRVTETREVPKYQHIKDKYVLEQLVATPEINLVEIGIKTTYEPLWTFEDNKGFPLPPKWEACEIVIKTVQAARDKDVVVYKDPIIEDPDEIEKFDKTYESLFGNETSTTDALSHREGIVVPNNYKTTEESKS